MRESEDSEPENCFSSQVGKRVVRALASQFAEVFGTQVGSGEVVDVDTGSASLLVGEILIQKFFSPKMCL